MKRIFKVFLCLLAFNLLIVNVLAEESNNNIKEVISDFSLTELVDSDSFTKNEIADEYETLRNNKDEKR